MTGSPAFRGVFICCLFLVPYFLRMKSDRASDSFMSVFVKMPIIPAKLREVAGLGFFGVLDALWRWFWPVVALAEHGGDGEGYG